MSFMHVGRVGRQMCIKEPSFCPLAETRFGSRRHFRPPNMAGEAGLSAAEVAPEKRLSSLSGTFGRRRCRRTCMSFASVWEFRPPKVPPNLPDFRLWRDFRPPNLPPKVPCPAFLCMIYVIVLRCFRGFLGSILESCSCMFGPSFESTCVGSDPRNRGPQQ